MRLMLPVLIALLALRASAGYLEGTVVDSVNGEPLVGATVSVKGTELGASPTHQWQLRL